MYIITVNYITLDKCTTECVLTLLSGLKSVLTEGAGSPWPVAHPRRAPHPQAGLLRLLHVDTTPLERPRHCRLWISIPSSALATTSPLPIIIPLAGVPPSTVLSTMAAAMHRLISIRGRATSPDVQDRAMEALEGFLSVLPTPCPVALAARMLVDPAVGGRDCTVRASSGGDGSGSRTDAGGHGGGTSRGTRLVQAPLLLNTTNPAVGRDQTVEDLLVALSLLKAGARKAGLLGCDSHWLVYARLPWTSGPPAARAASWAAAVPYLSTHSLANFIWNALPRLLAGALRPVWTEKDREGLLLVGQGSEQEDEGVGGAGKMQTEAWDAATDALARLAVAIVRDALEADYYIGRVPPSLSPWVLDAVRRSSKAFPEVDFGLREVPGGGGASARRFTVVSV